jgi:hypothetical protein
VQAVGIMIILISIYIYVHVSVLRLGGGKRFIKLHKSGYWFSAQGLNNVHSVAYGDRSVAELCFN